MKTYVTFRWRLPVSQWPKKLSGRKAIECPDEKSALRVASTLLTLITTYRVSINKSGNIPKDARIIPFECFQNDEYHFM